MTEQEYATVAAGHGPVDRDPRAGWNPVVGSETSALLDRALADVESHGAVLAKTRSILARCVPPSPNDPDPRTGLVIGYVQSGKTLSFTALTAMARDNGHPLVILLAGTKTVLHDQTSARLRSDLRALRPGGMSPWLMMANPDDSAQTAADLAGRINATMDPATPNDFRRTTVITVMKNKARIEALRSLLSKLGGYGVDMRTLPVIVIDDEADQAGMNAGRSKNGVKQETATYASILGLRDVIPNSSYVMYTATPQAPLLISIADALSPDYVNVLDPGPGYTGGKYFFDERRAEFVTRMDDAEVARALDPAGQEPPESLELAVATFFIAKSIVGADRMISMLVHPSHSTDLHTVYGGYVTRLLGNWRSLLSTPGPDRDEVIETYFRPAYEGVLRRTERDVPALEELLVSVPHWIGATQIRVINADPTNTDDLQWNSAPAWVVIGGNKLDRGFTIEGLAVTYMPRGTGVGNADTIQQRARFFGYKGAYGDLCRAWLPFRLAEAYETYVDHEEHLRSEMSKIEVSGEDLQRWTRKMLLDPVFKPTRRAVIELPILHNRFKGNSWTAVDRVAFMDEMSAQANMLAVVNLRSEFDEAVLSDVRDPRAKKHDRFSVPMARLLAMLVDWKGRSEDVVTVQQLCLVMQAHLDSEPSLDADVYLMDCLETRRRGVSSDKRTVTNLQQGANPRGVALYPGDKTFYTDGRLSVQFHAVQNREDQEGPWSAVGMSIRVPSELAGAALFQFPADEEQAP
ncbi:Z1 domain-containing protein [Aeromicrobium massiliense]|uniref:Z1 domain-containing protein n=1 Tax=Aeromicrobium massiliense TaxID=1464554 RepID=UPI00030AAD80|nr:Z1 domain-containing protein [Aeromicrobium massiliense]